MALDLSIFAADTAAVVADMPVSVTIGDVTRDAAVSDVARGQKLEIPGFAGECDLALTMVADATLIAAAKPPRVATVAGVGPVRIERPNLSACGSTLILYCVHVTK